MECLTGVLVVVSGKMAISALIGVGVAWVFKKIPNAKLRKAMQGTFGKAGYALGVMITLGLSKWKYTKDFWNKTIEPWLIDFIEHVLAHSVLVFLDGIVKGMRSDD